MYCAKVVKPRKRYRFGNSICSDPWDKGNVPFIQYNKTKKAKPQKLQVFFFNPLPPKKYQKFFMPPSVLSVGNTS